MTKDQSKLLKLGVAVLIAIVSGLALWKFDMLEAKYSRSPVTISPALTDLGDISMAKGNVSIEATINNGGPDPVTISGVQTSCMCTTAQIDGVSFGMHQNPSTTFTIPPKGTKRMMVTFDPNAHGPEATGPITRIVFVRTNSEKNPSLEMRFSGNVIK